MLLIFSMGGLDLKNAFNITSPLSPSPEVSGQAKGSFLIQLLF